MRARVTKEKGEMFGGCVRNRRLQLKFCGKNNFFGTLGQISQAFTRAAQVQPRFDSYTADLITLIIALSQSKGSRVSEVE